MTPDADPLAAFMPRLVTAWRHLRGSSSPPEMPRSMPLSTAERRDVVMGAERLSQGLTRERELAGARYFSDPQLLGAYLLLYWPVSFAQGLSVLGELPGPPGDVLDLGAGPAPLALAALERGARSARAIDRSREALDVARRIAQDAGLPLATEVGDVARPPDGSWDTILLGHVLNELSPDREKRAAVLESLLARLRPGGHLIVIEPALRETSRALLEVRDLVVARGASVRAPCLYRAGCPALARESDWCHAERPLRPPPPVDELAAAARLHRDAIKMSYLVLEAPGAAWPSPPPGHVFRIVSEPLDRKGQHRYVGCGPEGRTAVILPTKNVTERNSAFTTLQRGDVIRMDGFTVRGDGLRIERDGTVDKLAGAGEPVPPTRDGDG
jgi:ribosomal protein RSM22 (predicted rRNA methylase)